MTSRHLSLLVAGACLACAADVSRAQTIWTGPSITFTKSAATPQDPLTPSVALTRGSSQGMFNNAPGQETVFTATSPKNTEWATSIIPANASKTITATNYAALTFDTWTNAYNTPSMSGTLNGNITTHDAVVHLISDNIYLNLHFTSFQAMGGGGFSYVRSTPVPEPGAACLLLMGIPAIVAIARKHARNTR